MRLLKYIIFILRLITSLFLGWTFALFGEGLMGGFIFQPLLFFWFIFSFVFLLFWGVSQNWSLIDIGIFDSACFMLWYLLYSML